ncbi:bifunctional ADP-heptose synthase (sugar kinase/adenylyltransferase) [Bradyrhizobium sp. LB7.1]
MPRIDQFRAGRLRSAGALGYHMGNLPTDNPASTAQLAAHEKIKTIEELGEIARSAQAQGRKVALCHGVFDLVHLGHIRHIQAAHNEGDVASW